MTIASKDIVILASEVMADVLEGGGAPTNTLISGSASNEIFDDTTDFDSSQGTVQVRQIYSGVWTDDTERALGMRSYIASQPADKRFTALLAESEMFDRQTAIKNRMEQYYGKGTTAVGYLFENHVKNQRSIQLFMRPSDASPVIGATLVLVQNEGEPTAFEQYVRVADKAEMQRTFTDSNGKPYVAKIATLDITAGLEYDFTGSPPSEFFSAAGNAVKIREASVIDANRYYSCQPLAADATAGDTVLRVDSVFQQLIPSSQQETPLPDQRVSGDQVTLIQAGDDVSVTLPALAAEAAVYLGNPIYPNSLRLAVSSDTYTDKAGVLLRGDVPVGVVDYALGTFTPSINISAGVATFKPAGAPLLTHESVGLEITPERQAYNYVVTLTPPPEPGTLRMYYPSLGQWYALGDDGSGVLSGADSRHGSGTVSYVTGTVSITCGAYPDADSTLIITHGDRATTIDRSGQSVAAPSIAFQLSESGIDTNQMTVTWSNGSGGTLSATADAAGVFTGDATGFVRTDTGKLELAPNTLVAGGTSFAVTYSYGAKETKSFASPALQSNGDFHFDLTQTQIVPNSIVFEFAVKASVLGDFEGAEQVIRVRDDGQGQLVREGDSTALGSIDYAAGTGVLSTSIMIRVLERQYSLVNYFGG